MSHAEAIHFFPQQSLYWARHDSFTVERSKRPRMSLTLRVAACPWVSFLEKASQLVLVGQEKL